MEGSVEHTQLYRLAGPFWDAVAGMDLKPLPSAGRRVAITHHRQTVRTQFQRFVSALAGAFRPSLQS